MTIIQPVTLKTPSNFKTLEESGLPFGFVVTPFAHRTAVSNGDDDKFNNQQRRNNKRPITRHDFAKSKRKNKVKADVFPIKATMIAKCTYCGSPINPTCTFVRHWNVLCSICGNVYDAHYESQFNARKIITESERSASNSWFSLSSKNDNDDDSLESENYMSQEEAEYTRRYASGFHREECVENLNEYSLPLLQISVPNASSSKRGKKKKEDVYTLPAKLCPPLLAIFIDGTSSDAAYYERIADCLKQLINPTDGQYFSDDEDGLDDEGHNDNDSGSEHINGKGNNCDRFKGTRMGIFVMTKNGSLSVFDLTNPGGHLKHLWVDSCSLPLNPDYEGPQGLLERGTTRLSVAEGGMGAEEDYNVAPLKDVMTAEQIFAPLDDYGISCVENAIRELRDSSIAIKQACQREDDTVSFDSNRSGTGSGIYLGSTLQYFFEFMQDVAYHPGEMPMGSQNEDDSAVKGASNEACNKFLYAGGKIMCFLSKAPDEIGDIIIPGRNGRVGAGGFGGSCAEVGKRFSTTAHNATISSENGGLTEDLEDIESGTSKKTKHSKRNDATATSSQRASVAIGSDDELSLPQTKYLGVGDYYQDLGTACAMSAFGFELFALLQHDDDNNKEHDKKGESFIGIPFLRLLSDRSGGCGPLIYTLPKHLHEPKKNKHTNNDTLMNELIARCPWHRTTAFGTMLRIRLSPSLGIDTNLDRTLKRSTKGKNVHQLQKFAITNGMHGSATSSITDDEICLIGACDPSHSLSFDVEINSRSGEVNTYVTVDGTADYRLTPCIQISFAYTSIVKNNQEWVTVRRLRIQTEELHLTESVESLTSSLDPESLVVNLFHKFQINSLENGLRSTEDYAMNWLLSALLRCYDSAKELHRKIEAYGDRVSDETLFAGDRLLNIAGSLKSKRDILLAQGHDEFQHLPLLCYALIQCDALRPSIGDFNPSIDAQAAAAANMSNMTPDAVARCIAPRVEFWVSGEASKEATVEAVNMNLNEVRYTIIDEIGTFESEGNEENVGVNEENVGSLPILFLDSPSNVLIYDCQDLCNLRPLSEADLPLSLLESKNDAVKSYRVRPPSFTSVGIKSYADNSAFSRITDAMVEDSLTPSKHESYEKWCTLLAEILHSEISSPS